jgi:hypothetical protein
VPDSEHEDGFLFAASRYNFGMSIPDTGGEGSRLLRRFTPRRLANSVRVRLHQHMEERLYFMTAEDALQLPAKGIMRRNQIQDLELSRSFAEEEFMTRDQVREMWQERLKTGQHVFTFVKDEILVCYGWMVERQAHTYVLKGHKVDLPAGSAGIYNFYTDPEYRQGDYYPNSLIEAFQAAARVPGTARIYFSVPAELSTPRWWVERLGSIHEATYFYDRRLWRTRIWKEEANGAANGRV